MDYPSPLPPPPPHLELKTLVSQCPKLSSLWPTWGRRECPTSPSFHPPVTSPLPGKQRRGALSFADGGKEPGEERESRTCRTRASWRAGARSPVRPGSYCGGASRGHCAGGLRVPQVPARVPSPLRPGSRALTGPCESRARAGGGGAPQRLHLRSAPSCGAVRKTPLAGKVQAHGSRKAPKCRCRGAGLHPPPRLRSIRFAVLPRVGFIQEPPSPPSSLHPIPHPRLPVVRV